MALAISQPNLFVWWAPALAFFAGVVSFASPCVMPLVPGYVSFISGRRAVDDKARRPLTPILLFISGFTIVFTLLGAFSAKVIPKIKSVTGQRIAGGFIVAVGLFMVIYALQRGSVALFQERRPFLEKVKPGTAGALPLGMAFAAGWTPCIGPVLGAILALASSGGVTRGAILLVFYSLGLGLPFLLVGLGVQRLMGTFGWIKRNYGWIAGVSGALLIVVGFLTFTGRWTRLIAPLARRFTPAV